ncbi:MAG: hypothetical protein IJP86_04365 [Synergistaceae bacterium]|nr:hypothetical protein [Synergistaceae bacterium]
MNLVTGLLGRNSNTAGNTAARTGTPSSSRSSRITYQDKNGNTHTLTMTSGEFNNSHPSEKQYFGKYIEYTDENGHVVARYSPYVNFLQMAEGLDDADSARDAAVQDLRRAGLQRLMQFGLADEAGLLVDDGNEDFRHKHRIRLDTNPEGITVHPVNNKKSTGQRVDNRTFWQKVNDNRKERKAFREVRDKIYQKLVNAYSEAVERNPDIITSRRLRQNYRTNSKAVAHLAASSIRGFAHAYGMSINDYFNNAMHLDVIFNPKEKGTNGFMRFIQPGEITEDGVRHETAEMVLNITKFANESTAIHEFLHSFRREMENLITTVDDLPQGMYDDFAAMNRWLGISDIDFSTPYNSWTKEQQVRYKNAQEKWASAGEQYFATGKSPTIWLKHIFNKFKVWMANVYGAVKNIRYAGEDGHTHEVEITPETRKFFDNLLKDVSYVPSEKNRQARLALAKDTSRSSQGEEFHNQTASGRDKGQGYSRETDEVKDLQLNLPFSPDALRTESGNTIDEAKSSELLLTPEGSAALSYIDANTAEAAGIQAGEIQANVGVLRHAENHHGKQIRQAGYKDAKTFLLDTLHNWKDIREGSNNSLWLVAPKDDGHGAVAAVRLHQDKNGIYRVSTLLFARNRAINSKELLFAGRPSPASSSGSGMNLTRASSLSPGTSAAKGGSSLEQSLNAKSQAVTSDNDLTPEVQSTHALSIKSVHSGSSSVNTSSTKTLRIGRSNSTFVSQEDIERFDQLALHGTGHIILNSRFGLEYIGTGEGGQAFGYGIYLAQNPAVADYYRRYGRNISILDKQGLPVSGSDNAIKTLQEYLLHYTGDELRYNFAQVKHELLAKFKAGARQARDELMSELGHLSEQSIARLKQEITLNREISRILSKQAASFEAANGNVYKADIPENDALLDWEADTQPKKVQKGIQRVVAKLETWNVSHDAVDKVRNAKTGEDFYHALEDALRPLVQDRRLNSKKHGGIITRTDMAASLLLNQAGVQGLRYLDKGSRNTHNGTHNFVIWNTDMIKLLGLTDDSDEDAKQYFRDTAQAGQQGSSEAYHQIIGIDGARSLDAAEGVTTRMDNLRVARRMERAGLTASKIWAATSWMRGKDGKWRHEIPDGSIMRSKLGKLRTLSRELDHFRDTIYQYARTNPNLPLDTIFSRQELDRFNELLTQADASLPDVLDAPALFSAYPDLRGISVRIDKNLDAYAAYDPNTNSVIVADSDRNFSVRRELRKSLIHEIQHAIQMREGFASGSDISPDNDAAYNRYMARYHSIMRKLDTDTAGRIADALEAELEGDNDALQDILRSLSGKERNIYSRAMKALNKADERGKYLYSKYMRRSGETEARNAEHRAYWGEKRRRAVPLDASEDVSRDEQIVGRLPRKSSSRSKSSSETYSQALNSDVDLDSQVRVVHISQTMPNVPFYKRIKAFGKDRQAEIISRFKNGAVVNEHTGLTITLSKVGLNHILDTARNTIDTAGDVIYQAVPYLDTLARKAYRVETHPDRKPSATKVEGQPGNLKQVHRFLVPVQFGDDTHILKLTAKEYESGKAEIDEVSLYDMKYTKKMSGHLSQNSPNLMGRAAETSSSPNIVSVRDMLEGVNDAEGNPYSERYSQFIGYGAAARLDQLNSNHNLTYNLRTARRMERKLKPDWRFDHYNGWKRDYSSARKIWFATGWLRGADGQWKFELPYGHIISKAFHDLASKNISRNNDGSVSFSEIKDIPLSSIFDAPELFKAYDSLKNIPVTFEAMGDDRLGYINSEGNKIFISNKLLQSQFTVEQVLIHEIQHWIQSIEGFAQGGNTNMGWVFKGSPALADKNGFYFNPTFFRSLNAKREAQTILDNISPKQQEVFRALFDVEKRLSTDSFNQDEYDSLLHRLSPKNKQKFRTWAKLMHDAKLGFGMLHQAQAYSYFGGEVEARNAAKRSIFSEQRRKSSFPLDTQDTASEEQFIFDSSDKPFSYRQDRDKEAADYFRSTILQKLTGNPHETYQQVIGRKGAQLIDRAIGADWLMSNLETAQQMKARGFKPKTIRRATGWELGHDKQWRYETRDGKLKDNLTLNATVPDFDTFEDIPFGMETQPFAVTTLGEVLDAPDLFAAYPKLREASVTFVQGEDFEENGIRYPKGSSHTDGSVTLVGDFHFDGHSLRPGLNQNTILTLLHEIQHNIQRIEGFAGGSNLDLAAQNLKAVKDLDRKIEALQKQLDALYRAPLNEDIFADNPQSKEYNDLEQKLFGLMDERDNLIQNAINDGTARNRYMRSAGETEARNVMARHSLSDAQRRNSLLTDTEDFNHNELLDDNGETYNQAADAQQLNAEDFDATLEISRQQLETVRMQYEGSPQWMKAPNGQPTNLTEKQWLQVRTPNFKNWFGDWEAAHIVKKVRDFLEHSEPVGSISGEEFSKTDTPLVDRVMQYYKNTGNTVVHNKELGDVVLDRRGIKDSAAHGLGKEKSAAFALVPDVIKKGLVYDRQTNWKGRSYDTATLIANVKIGGQDYVCEVIVKQSKNRQGFYLHEVEVKDNLDGVFKTALNDGTPSRSRLIISRYAGEANNSSKVVDENGEPLVVTHIVRGKGGFSVFNTNGDFSIDREGKTEGTGAWFADLKGNEHISLETAGIDSVTEGGNIYHVFLNLRNPYVYDAEGKRWQRVGKVWIVDTKTGKSIFHNNAGKAFSNLSWANGFIREHLDPDNTQPGRYIVRHETRFQTSDELVRAVRQGIVGNGDHDGVVIRNLRDMSVWGVDDYVVFEPNAIKSATNNNGMFSQSGEIYRQASAGNAQDKDTPSSSATLGKYYDILSKSNPHSINPDNLLQGTHGFTTPDVIERYYQQEVTHATGHIVLGNRFSLKYLFSGEGSNYFGAGIYFEQNPEVAEFYRRYGVPNMGLGTLHVQFSDGTVYSAPKFDEWDNTPSPIIRKVLNAIQEAIFYNQDFSVDNIKHNLNVIYTLAINAYGENSDSGKEAQEALKVLDTFSHWEFTPDENFGKKGNLYIAEIPDNDVLMNWDALLNEQPEHVQKAIAQIKTFISDFARKYNLDVDEAWDEAREFEGGHTLRNSGGEFYEFVTNIMKQYLENNSPDDGIDNPQLRASLLFLKFGIPGHRYWDSFSSKDIHDKYDEYRKNNMLDGRPAKSIATTADGHTYSLEENSSWSNNPDDTLREVLNDIQSSFSSSKYNWFHADTFQEAKDKVLDKYQSNIKQSQRYLREAERKKDNIEIKMENENIEYINVLIDVLNSITSFTFSPAIKPAPYSPFSVFGNEGTRNFVIWDEDLVHILGITSNSNQEAIDYFNNYKREHPDKFITPDAVDRFNQIVTHATGNIIWDNRFDLRYAGSSEGSAAFGFGAYFTQNPYVAESYRRYGLSDKDLAGNTSFTLKGGKSFSFADRDNWKDDFPDVHRALFQFVDFFGHNPHASYSEALAAVKDNYKALISKHKGRKDDKDLLDRLRRELHVINSITDISHTNPKRGNIYQFDIPEDYELLDWDAPLDEQPGNVRKAIRKIFAALKRKGFSRDELRIHSPHIGELDTGEDFYWAIVRAFEHMDRIGEDLYGLKKKGFSRADARASWLLNRYGIPGHRYFDRGSRYSQSGTHNYVIWNMDRVTMTGISDDSDELTRKTFYNGGKQQLSLFDSNGNPASNGFISPEQIERYEQQMWHGTDNTILGNEFDLRYAGSSEGSASRAYGAYMAGNRAVAETYRHYGDQYRGSHRVGITTDDGKVYRSTGAGSWDRGADGYLKPALDDLFSLAVNSRSHDLDTLKKDILASYRHELKELRSVLTQLKHELKHTPHNDTNDKIKLRQHIIDNTKHKIEALKSITAISVLPPKKGNIYSFDGPENNTLLDWDAGIPKQPDSVKKARQEILQELKFWGLDASEARKAKTGGDFYMALAHVMRTQTDDLFAYPAKGIADPKQKASLILHRHGIPGAMFWDSGSRELSPRERRKSGTHNFVIWDTRTLAMLGVEGNPDAEEHFRITAAQQQANNQAEAYNQQANKDNAGHDTSSSFLSQKKYDQLMHHGTRHILLRNGFDLQYFSSEQGQKSYREHQKHGYGAHLTEAYDIADSARTEAMKGNNPYQDKLFVMKNGKNMSSSDIARMEDAAINSLSELDSFKELFKNGDVRTIRIYINPYDFNMPLHNLAHAEHSELYSTIDDVVRDALEKIESRISSEEKTNSSSAKLFRQFWEKGGKDAYIEAISKLIPDRIKAPSKGNLYTFSGPDNDTLLDWDAPMRRQPKKVLDILRNSDVYIDDYDTGESLYRRLSNENGGGLQGDMAASRILNQLGIPGHRYLDSTDRQGDKHLYNSHSFVIWNTDTLSMLGLSEDSNEEAQDYFRAEDYSKAYLDSLDNDGDTHDYEQYRQIIGTTGARRLDRLNGNTELMDNLAIARNMFRLGIDAKTIWRNTGWEMATDGDWRHEIMDGHLIPFNGNKNLTLPDIFDAQELYNAYPRLREVKVSFDKNWDDPLTGGWWDRENNTIHFPAHLKSSLEYALRDKNTNDSISRDWDSSTTEDFETRLLHEVQHAIQSYEDFATGGNPNMFTRSHRLTEGYHLAPNEAYSRLAGEVEARNASKRKNLSQEERINTPLAETEDVEREKQLAFRNEDELERRSSENVRDNEYDFYADEEGKAFLDALDNDSDITDYDSEMAHIDDLADAHSDALDNLPDTETYSQAKAAYELLTPEAKQQVDAIRAKYKGTPQWMKAPNGKKTNLSELQWLLVRTENFKRWFGDWEHDRRNSSKIIDTNGEPLVVYHGTLKSKRFKIFNTHPEGSHFGSRNSALDRIAYSTGYDGRNDKYFDYSSSGKIIPCFLNIRNPLFQNDSNDWKNDIRDAKKSGYDGIIYENLVEDKGNDSFVIFTPNQTKSATKNNGEFSNNEGDFYRQTAASNDDYPYFGIDAEGRQLMLRFNPPEIDAIYEYHKKNGSLFLAPNGKKSKLDNRSWLLVRTNNFKNWFGDWENSPGTASKVVDENGEPLIVTHLPGWGGGFSKFKTNGYGKTRNTGAWFGDYKDEAIFNDKRFYQEGDTIYHVFLNLRNPYIYDAHGKDWENIGQVWIRHKFGGKNIFHNNHGEPFTSKKQAQDYIYSILLDPYTYEAVEEKLTSDHLVRAVRTGKLGNGNHDGVIIRDIHDMATAHMDDYIIFKPIQVKSKFNSGAFSNSNTEIYRQSADTTQSNSLARPADDFLTPEARTQVEAVRKEYEGTTQWLKAPNGHDTNLNEAQWLAVRTPNFKAWFGDWENSPDTSSKVVDENGEPLVVYHGTPNGGFSVFDTRGEGMSHDTGAWFTSRRENAETYSNGDDEGLYEVFLNIRNP